MSNSLDQLQRKHQLHIEIRQDKNRLANDLKMWQFISVTCNITPGHVTFDVFTIGHLNVESIDELCGFL